MAWTKLYPGTKWPRRDYHGLDMVQNGLAQTVPGDKMAWGYCGRLHRHSPANVPAPGVRAMAGRGTRDVEHEMRFHILSAFPCAGRSVLTLFPPVCLSLSFSLSCWHVDCSGDAELWHALCSLVGWRMCLGRTVPPITSLTSLGRWFDLKINNVVAFVLASFHSLSLSGSVFLYRYIIFLFWGWKGSKTEYKMPL